MTPRHALGVVIGGVIGAVGRWGFGELMGANPGLLVANALGCLVLGWAVAAGQGPWLTAGACGALTSFSALALQLAVDLDQTRYVAATSWLVVTVVLCTGAFRLGRQAHPLRGER